MNRQMPVLLKPFVLLTYVLLLAPLVIVVAVSFGTSPNYQFPPTQLSLKWYRAFFSNPEFVRAFFSVSLVLGLLAAIFATLLGAAAAIGLVRFRFKGRETLEAFFLAPLFIPEILFGASLYLTYARLGIKPSITSLLFGHVVVCAPFVIRNVTAGLVGLDPRLEEAAMSLWREPRAGLRQGRPTAHSVEHHLRLHLRVHHLIFGHQSGAVHCRTQQHNVARLHFQPATFRRGSVGGGGLDPADPGRRAVDLAGAIPVPPAHVGLVRCNCAPRVVRA